MNVLRAIWENPCIYLEPILGTRLTSADSCDKSCDDLSELR